MVSTLLSFWIANLHSSIETGMLIVYKLAKHLTTDLSQRMFWVAAAFGLVFSGESVVLLLTTLNPQAFTVRCSLPVLDLMSSVLFAATFRRVQR